MGGHALTPWDEPLCCAYTSEQLFNLIGYSIRSSEWRCTFWLKWNRTTLSGNFVDLNSVEAIELYEHKDYLVNNFGKSETENVEKNFANKEIIEEFWKLAKDHWQRNFSY